MSQTKLLAMWQAKLKAKVVVVNRANACANHLHGILLEIFTPLVGTKILKADGSFTKAVEKLLPVLPNTRELSVSKLPTIYTLDFVIHSCEPVQGDITFVRHETSFYIGNIDKGRTLVKISSPVTPHPAYTVAEIIERRDAYKRLQEAADHIKSTLSPFGVSD